MALLEIKCSWSLLMSLDFPQMNLWVNTCQIDHPFPQDRFIFFFQYLKNNSVDIYWTVPYARNCGYTIVNKIDIIPTFRKLRVWRKVCHTYMSYCCYNLWRKRKDWVPRIKISWRKLFWHLKEKCYKGVLRILQLEFHGRKISVSYLECILFWINLMRINELLLFPME